MKTLVLPLLVVLAVAVGCGSSGDDAVTGAMPTGPGKVIGETKDGAKVMGSTPGQIPEGGIALQPSNPDNPVYKADPELKGGG